MKNGNESIPKIEGTPIPIIVFAQQKDDNFQ
jgi:hypothetical protein